VQGVDQRLFTVSSSEPEQGVELGFQAGVADGGSTNQELLRFEAKGAEPFLCLGFRRRSPRPLRSATPSQRLPTSR
jgi:hypothetical protein